MRDFEKHQFRKQYPNAARLYHEKIEEKRRIAKNIKRGILASKKALLKSKVTKKLQKAPFASTYQLVSTCAGSSRNARCSTKNLSHVLTFNQPLVGVM
jgi:hypothetical protein